MNRRDAMRKALADAGVAVAQGQWAEDLLDRLEAAAALPATVEPLPVPEEESNPT